MPFELYEDDVQQQNAPEESFGSEAIRHIGRTATRIGEQIAGTPGDILSLINEYIAAPVASKITGGKEIPYEELGISSLLPTSQTLQKGHEKELGESVKPKNKVEGFFDDVFRTATSLFSPGAVIKKGSGVLKGIGASLFKSTGAHLAKEATEDLTADEKKGTYAHLGALSLLSFLDKKGAAKAISEGYKPLEQKARQMAPLNANLLETNLNNLKSKMKKGTLAPSEKFVVDEVDAVLDKIKNGTITAEEAWASKRSLNEKLAELHYENPRARVLAKGINAELKEVLYETEKQDPKFFKELKAWDKAYQTVAESKIVSKWVEKNVKYAPVAAPLLKLFGSSIGTVASGSVLPYQALKVAYRIAKSPKLASHYSKSLAAAVAEDSISFNRELKKLDQALQKENKKDQWEPID